MQTLLLPTNAPHRDKHLLVAVKHTLRTVLVSLGRTETQAAGASDDHATNGLAFVQDRIAGYLTSGTPAEEAYDLALTDLSDWARQLP